MRLIPAPQKTFVISLAIIGTFLSSSHAQEWNLKSGDERLNDQQLTEMLVGASLVFQTGERAVFHTDGTYVFKNKGKSFEFDYVFTPDGAICITSPDYGSRCDLMVNTNDGLVSINEKGGRFSANVAK